MVGFSFPTFSDVVSVGERIKNQQQRTPQQCQPNPQRVRRPERQLDPMSLPYSQIIPYFLKSGSVTLKELASPILPYPSDFDVSTHCEYHMGTPRHTMVNCKVLKYKVQELIDCNAIKFTQHVQMLQQTPCRRIHSRY